MVRTADAQSRTTLRKTRLRVCVCAWFCDCQQRRASDAARFLSLLRRLSLIVCYSSILAEANAINREMLSELGCMCVQDFTAIESYVPYHVWPSSESLTCRSKPDIQGMRLNLVITSQVLLLYPSTNNRDKPHHSMCTPRSEQYPCENNRDILTTIIYTSISKSEIRYPVPLCAILIPPVVH